MKHLLLILLMLFLSNTWGAFGQVATKGKTNDLQRLKIGAVLGSSIIIREGLVDANYSKSSVAIYNERGLPIQQLFTTINEKESIAYIYDYGPCDEYLNWIWVTKKGNRVDTVQTQHVLFDANCRMVQITWTDSVGKLTETRYIKYDNKGRTLMEEDKDAKNKVTARVQYTYPDSLTVDKAGILAGNNFWYHSREIHNKKGDIIQSISFNKEGKLEYSRRIERLYIGKLLASDKYYDAAGKLTGSATYSYNADGLLEEAINKTQDTETISVYRYKKR
jgi:hypothetical protein